MEAPVVSGMFRALVLGLLVLFSLAARQAAAQGDSEAGIALYKTQNCMECHGDEGKGDGFVLPMLKVKVQMNDWTDKAAMSKLTDEYLAEITVKGGEALGKSEVMLKYDKFTEQQAKDLVAFIRSLAR